MDIPESPFKVTSKTIRQSVEEPSDLNIQCWECRTNYQLKQYHLLHYHVSDLNNFEIYYIEFFERGIALR